MVVRYYYNFGCDGTMILMMRMMMIMMLGVAFCLYTNEHKLVNGWTVLYCNQRVD